jgi:hypothetical protein
MMKRWSLLAALLAVGACGDDGNGGNDTPTFDAAIPDDAEVPPGCDPATVLPTAYRPIASVSTGTVQVTTAGGVTSGTLDATAGGAANSADQPYLYVDLRNGTRVDINDLEAWSSTQWDIAQPAHQRWRLGPGQPEARDRGGLVARRGDVRADDRLHDR